ncbi:MAG: ABC transporter permease [Bacteroidales bacterium]|nr:ABC transporter permease [Bacteroidales bacterium]MDD3908092.1 ABC transporter permease [Bacteroidales bacterium]MDD4713369.1 ABC transporter permease [Bacteroidales bacterium]
MVIKYLIEKEFKQFRRNRFLSRLVFIFPFVMLSILPLAANFEVKDLNLTVVDNSHSSYSRRLVQKIAASRYFHLTSVSSTYSQALKRIEQDQSDMILEIPPSFEQDLIREKNARVMISANAVNGMKGGLGSAYLAGILAEYNAEIRQELLPSAVSSSQAGLEVSKLYRFNPLLDYKFMMVPAIMVMLITMICGFLPAFNIVSEKEAGTIEQMNVTPVSKFSLILSKLIPYWVVGFVVLTICFGVAWLFYGLWPKGSILTIYLFASVFVLAFSGLGLIVSNYAKTLQQAMFMVFFLVITFIFMSGLYTPVDNMPQWGQYISDISPLKYFLRVMRLVYLKGSSTADLIKPFLALCTFAVVFNTWAVLSYRKSQ